MADVTPARIELLIDYLDEDGSLRREPSFPQCNSSLTGVPERGMI